MASKPLRVVQNNYKHFVQSRSQSFIRRLRKPTMYPFRRINVNVSMTNSKIKTFTNSINPIASFTSHRVQNTNCDIHSIASESTIQQPPRAHPKKSISDSSTCVKNKASINHNEYGKDWVAFGVVFGTCIGSSLYVNYYDKPEYINNQSQMQ
eukprot:186370_1